MNAHTFLFVESNDINYPYHMMGIAKNNDAHFEFFNDYLATVSEAARQ